MATGSVTRNRASGCSPPPFKQARHEFRPILLVQPADPHRETGLAARVRDARRDGGEEIVFRLRDDHADDLGLFMLEAFVEGVGMVIGFARQGLDAQPRILADVRVSGKRPGNSGYGNTRFPRDVLDRGLFHGPPG